MESRHIRYFLAAYDAGTFASAAERLNLSQQAVSKSIQRLESQLGVRLFERDGRRIRPTAYAELFLPYARTIAAEAERFRANLGDMLGGRRGLVRIGVGPSAAADMVAAAANHLAEECPGLRMQVLAGIYEDMIEDLVCGKLDLFVAVRQVERHAPLIREEKLCDIAYVVVAGAGHPLAGSDAVELETLVAECWISGANLGIIEESIENSFAAHGLALPRPEIETTSVLFTLAMLDRGRHLSILPAMLVQNEIASGRLVKLRLRADPWTRPLIVATRARGVKSPLVHMLIKQFRAHLATAG